jgi:hypothetical protein
VLVYAVSLFTLQGVVSPDGLTVTLPANDKLVLGTVLQSAADGSVRRDMYRAANAACASNAEVSHLCYYGMLC